jgi:hypothetical protein
MTLGISAKSLTGAVHSLLQVVWMTDTSEEAARRRAAEQLSAATAAMVTQGNIEAERAEAEKKAKKEAKRKVGHVLYDGRGSCVVS